MSVYFRIAFVLGCTAFLVLMGSEALAAPQGPTMPWDQPLTTIRDSLSGTVAHVVITIAVIAMGIYFALSEHGRGFSTLFGVTFGGAVALGALTFISDIGLPGVTF